MNKKYFSSHKYYSQTHYSYSDIYDNDLRRKNLTKGISCYSDNTGLSKEEINKRSIDQFIKTYFPKEVEK